MALYGRETLRLSTHQLDGAITAAELTCFWKNDEQLAEWLDEAAETMESHSAVLIVVAPDKAVVEVENVLVKADRIALRHTNHAANSYGGNFTPL